jgi:integrase
MDSERDLDNDFNYVIMNGKTPVKLVYLKYKTDKSYGKIKIPIPKQLQTILKAYISEYKLDNGDPLFGTNAGRYYKNFSSEISKVFEKYTQKKITANLIRHSFITRYLSKKRSTADKKKIAMLMGHSIESQSAYDRIDL